MPTFRYIDTRDRVRRWKLRGWPAQRIADKLGISKQSVYYHLHRLEEDGELDGAVKVYRTKGRAS